MSLVGSTKRELQKLRDDGWDSLMAKVASFCKKHNVEMLIMEEEFVDLRYPIRRTNISNMHHDKIQEFNDRFTEVTTDLLICMAALSPVDSFHGFDKEKLVRLAKLYPDDSSYGELLSLEQQLDIYIDNICRDERFKSVENLGNFSCLMVKTQKHLAHPLVYRFLKLVLTLPVATASVERCFSAMKLVKTVAHNRIGDQFLSDCMFSSEQLAHHQLSLLDTYISNRPFVLSASFDAELYMSMVCLSSSLHLLISASISLGKSMTGVYLTVKIFLSM
uniref:HAT C-terminal dimerisation domain-containing protein n=1 Tax=Brassica oleracea var. oleracea TaxID=109376 RepID=A0A0D3ED26_BRAOL